MTFHVLRPVVVYEHRRPVTAGWRCRVCLTVWDELPPLAERDRCPGRTIEDGELLALSLDPASPLGNVRAVDG